MNAGNRDAIRYRYLREEGTRYADPGTGAMVWARGEELDDAMDDAIAGITAADREPGWGLPESHSYICVMCGIAKQFGHTVSCEEAQGAVTEELTWPRKLARSQSITDRLIIGYEHRMKVAEARAERLEQRGSVGLEVATEATQANSTVNQPSAPHQSFTAGWKGAIDAVLEWMLARGMKDEASVIVDELRNPPPA